MRVAVINEHVDGTSSFLDVRWRLDVAWTSRVDEVSCWVLRELWGRPDLLLLCVETTDMKNEEKTQKGGRGVSWAIEVAHAPR